MGLLDDLKKQAEARQQAPSSHEDELDQFGKFRPVQKALQEVSRYFGELAQSLNVVKPDVRRQFYIEGSTRLSNLLQIEYTTRDRRKTVSGHDYLVEVSLRFTCAGDGNLVFQKDSVRLVDMMKEYFWAYSLPFECRDIRSERGNVTGGIVTLFSKVPASVTVTGDWETGKVELILRNIEVLGDIKQVFDVADIQRDFLEEIGKFVLAHPNKLRDFGKPQSVPTPAASVPQAGKPAYRVETEEPAPAATERGIVSAIKSFIKR